MRCEIVIAKKVLSEVVGLLRNDFPTGYEEKLQEDGSVFIVGDNVVLDDIDYKVGKRWVLLTPNSIHSNLIYVEGSPYDVIPRLKRDMIIGAKDRFITKRMMEVADGK